MNGVLTFLNSIYLSLAAPEGGLSEPGHRRTLRNIPFAFLIYSFDNSLLPQLPFPLFLSGSSLPVGSADFRCCGETLTHQRAYWEGIVAG